MVGWRWRLGGIRDVLRGGGVCRIVDRVLIVVWTVKRVLVVVWVVKRVLVARQWQLIIVVGVGGIEPIGALRMPMVEVAKNVGKPFTAGRTARLLDLLSKATA